MRGSRTSAMTTRQDLSEVICPTSTEMQTFKQKTKPLFCKSYFRSGDNNNHMIQTYQAEVSDNDNRSSSFLPSSLKRKNGDSNNIDRKLSVNHGKNNPDDHSPTNPTPRVLIVDDEPDVVTVMKRGLQRQGFQVDGFTDPVRALSSFTRHKYDIVFTDIRMSTMDGIELYRQLRKIDEDVVICFVTAYEHFKQQFEIAHPEEESTGCFIQKPISIDRLVAIITKKLDERDGKRHSKLSE